MAWRRGTGGTGIPAGAGEQPPVLTPTEKNWLESGRLLGQIYIDLGFTPEKLRDLHFDVLIALTARSHGARLITSNRSDFEMHKYLPEGPIGKFGSPSPPGIWYNWQENLEKFQKKQRSQYLLYP